MRHAVRSANIRITRRCWDEKEFRLSELPKDRLDAPLQLRLLEPRRVSRSRQFDGREIEIIDGLPDWSSRASVETAGMWRSPICGAEPIPAMFFLESTHP